MSTAMIRTGQVAITVILLVVLWRFADGQQAGTMLGAADPLWLLAALIALTAQTVMSAIRWRITAGQLGLELPVGVAVQEYYLSQIVNQLLPGGVLGDASRAVRSRQQRGLIAASQAVIFERLAGQIALFIVMTCAFVITYVRPGGLDWPSWALSINFLIIGGGIGLGLVFIAMTLVPSPLRVKAVNLSRSMTHALAARDVITQQVALSFGTTACNLAAFACCAHAVGIAVSPAMICALMPLVLFTMLVPLTVMGWGLREGAASVLLPLAGASASAGLAASVAFGLVMLVATLPGLLAVWTQRKLQDNGIST